LQLHKITPQSCGKTENNDGLTSLDVASTEAKEIILREAGGMNGHPKSLSSASKTDEEDNKSRMDTQSEP
jgi:hypothetical protein